MGQVDAASSRSLTFIIFLPPLMLLSSYIDSTSVHAVILGGRVLTGMLLGGIANVCVCVWVGACVCKGGEIFGH